jgi:multidrug resistance protein, MATE family
MSSPTFARRAIFEEFRALARLAAPLAAAQIGLMSLGVVDTMIVGRTRLVTGASGEEALAAVALGDHYVMTILLFGMGAMMGLDPVAAQRLGAGDPRGARRALGDALRAALLLTPLLFGLVALLDVFVLEPIAAGNPPWEELRAEPSVASAARAYAWTRAAGILPWLAFSALRSWFFAKHLVRPFIVSIVFGNLANAALDWVVVYGDSGLRYLGLPELGLPAFGTTGAGVVSAVVNAFMALALLPPLLRARRDEEASIEAAMKEGAPPPAPAESRAKGVARILRIGVPIGGQIVMEVAIFNLVAVLTSKFGAAATAAHQIAIRVASLTFMASTGIGAAAAVRVGRAIGTGRTDAARRAGFVAVGAGGVWMIGCGMALALFPEAIVALFTDGEETLAIARPLLLIAAVFQIFDGVQAVVSGALRGAGDARVPFFACLLAYWLVGFPIAFTLKKSMGVAGLWWGLVAGLGGAAILLTWRFARLTRVDVDRVG